MVCLLNKRDRCRFFSAGCEQYFLNISKDIRFSSFCPLIFREGQCYYEGKLLSSTIEEEKYTKLTKSF